MEDKKEDSEKESKEIKDIKESKQNEENQENKDNKENKEDVIQRLKDLIEIKKKSKLPDYPINLKIQNKYINHLPFSTKKSKNLVEFDKNDKVTEEDYIKVIPYPSGVVKTITRNIKEGVTKVFVEYHYLKNEYIIDLNNNLDTELESLVYNSFLLYNRGSILKKIVKNPISTASLDEKILLFKHYIKDLSKNDKANLLRKLLNTIKKFSECCYDEFLKVNEVSNAHFLLSLNENINDKDHIASLLIHRFFSINSFIGADEDGNIVKDYSEHIEKYQDSANIMFLQTNILSIKDELNGTGNGYVFLRELKDIGDMYFNSSVIFESIFHDFVNIFDKGIISQFKFYKILLGYFSDYFICRTFVIKYLIKLNYLFGVYKQFKVVKFMNRLVLARFNSIDTIEDIKKEIEKIIGPEKSEKIVAENKNIKNKKDIDIDDIVNFIEGDKKEKKKKKKKKNKNKINQIDEIFKKYENKKEIDNDIKNDIDDGISIISEADSVLNNFKNDILTSTEYNIGNKIIPSLSLDFIEKFK